MTVLGVAGADVRGLHIVTRVGGEHFAFPVSQVEEAVDAPAVARVPAPPTGMLGQLVHRGRMVAAWDAAWAFRLRASTEVAATGVALVLRDGPRCVAFVVDDVLGMARVDPAGLRPVPEDADLDGVLRGVCRLEEMGHALVNVVRVDVLAAIVAPGGTIMHGVT